MCFRYETIQKGMMKLVENFAGNIPKKRWTHIIPAVMIMYIFAFMDRMNFGFAMAGGMNESLGITAQISGLAAGIFFIGYLVLQIQGGALDEKGGAIKFIALSILAWGGLSFLTGFVHQAWELMAIRFLLGVAEGGVWPIVMVIISHWFPEKERARANALFIMNCNIALIITGPISGYLIQNYGWRELFWVVGAVSVLLIFLWWPLVEDRPENAKWLSEEERNYLVATLKAESDEMKGENVPVSYKTLFKDMNFWKLTLFYFCFQVGDYGFMLWLPTILKKLTGFHIEEVGLLSILPFVAAMFGLWFIAVASDKCGKRRIYVAMPALIFAIAFVCSVQAKEYIWLSYIFMIVCGMFHNAYNGVFWAIPPALFPSETCGGARGFINGIGNLGGFVGPSGVGWVVTSTGSTDAGIYILDGFVFMAFLICMSLPKNKIDRVTC